jgi:hypothetical protein
MATTMRETARRLRALHRIGANLDKERARMAQAVRDQYPDLCCPHCGLWIGDTRDPQEDPDTAQGTLTVDDVLEITLLRAVSIDHDMDDCAERTQ